MASSDVVFVSYDVCTVRLKFMLDNHASLKYHLGMLFYIVFRHDLSCCSIL